MADLGALRAQVVALKAWGWERTLVLWVPEWPPTPTVLPPAKPPLPLQPTPSPHPQLMLN